MTILAYSIRNLTIPISLFSYPLSKDTQKATVILPINTYLHTKTYLPTKAHLPSKAYLPTKTYMPINA